MFSWIGMLINNTSHNNEPMPCMSVDYLPHVESGLQYTHCGHIDKGPTDVMPS